MSDFVRRSRTNRTGLLIAATAAAMAALTLWAGAAIAGTGGTGSGGGTTTTSGHGYVFPVPGRHTYGDGFGVARTGHRHQGQDILASCGKRIVAARAGKVQRRARQSAAGNYVVIDNDGTGQDFAYLHLQHASIPHVGDHVKTGQKIGYVGRTGNASACHLHFEIWTSPGYYEGGHPIDPKPKLKKWDAYS
jgi:murein DD-endopeptidase MepM/ murein hydrolase activator NlpD